MAVVMVSPHDMEFFWRLEALEVTLSMRRKLRDYGMCQCVGFDVGPVPYVNGVLDLTQHSGSGLADERDSVEKTGLWALNQHRSNTFKKLRA
jgi:hypothetical protein